MGLILEDILKEETIGSLVPKDATGAYLSVPRRSLSVPYELLDETVVTGEIREIKTWPEGVTDEAAREIVGMEIEFVLRLTHLGNFDDLFILKKSWPLLRDYGILPGQYKIKIILKEAKFGGEDVKKIYPKRDLVV